MMNDPEQVKVAVQALQVSCQILQSSKYYMGLDATKPVSGIPSKGDSNHGPHSAVGNVSGNRCESNCRSRGRGVQWLSGRVLDSGPKGSGFEPHRRHCVGVLEQDTFILA